MSIDELCFIIFPMKSYKLMDFKLIKINDLYGFEKN